MRVTNVALSFILVAAAAHAQVLAPEEIGDPQMRELQQKYRSELKAIANAAAAESFPYRFYFSRKLDLEEKDQKESDQRSIQFDRYRGQVVLKITGNYFVSYSADLVKPEERARQTWQTVILPLLQAAVPALAKSDAPEAFAFEISHHVRRRVLGVSTESAENVVVVLPRASAERLVRTNDLKIQQAAVLEGSIFLNAEPISLWPRTDEQISAPLIASVGSPAAAVRIGPKAPEKSQLSRDTSPEAIKELQKSYQSGLDRMVQELEGQAHFVRYAPPAFIPFHNGLYLQVSVSTELPQSASGSQYLMAALAFDQHIAHLIRPVLANFRDRGDFDGIDFSTTVRTAGADGGSVAVEFIVPLRLLSAYADFDTTGQQLIDSGFVLINGERVSLGLQAAETGTAVR